MTYVDGYVIPIPKKSIPAYRRLALSAGKLWRKHGALQYFECVGEDFGSKFGIPFPRAIKTKKNETVVFSFIIFKSRAHRDRVNAAVMKDPALANMNPNDMPFDCKRMIYSGFSVLVEA